MRQVQTGRSVPNGPSLPGWEDVNADQEPGYGRLEQAQGDGDSISTSGSTRLLNTYLWKFQGPVDLQLSE